MSPPSEKTLRPIHQSACTPTSPGGGAFSRVDRESGFAYLQASGPQQIAPPEDADISDSVKEAALYEPFTYWDWHGLTEDEWEHRVDERKRQSYRDRKKPHYAPHEDDEPEPCYPLGKERWESFKRKVQKSKDRWYVRRIAVSRWMTLGDLDWISKNLPALEALDLSDIEHNSESNMGFREGERCRPEWSEILKCLAREWPGITMGSKNPKFHDIEGELNFLREWDLDFFTCLIGTFRAQIASRLSAPVDVNQCAIFSGLIMRQNLADEKQELLGKKDVVEARRLVKGINEGPVEQKNAMKEKLKDVMTGIATPTYRISATLRRMKELDSIIPKEEKMVLSSRLKWLGIRQWEGSVGLPDPSLRVFQEYHSKFQSLETISVRGDYIPDRCETRDPEVLHRTVCCDLLALKYITPKNVANLELRHSVHSMPYLVSYIKKEIPNIQRIGIDLGALVQIYPLKEKKNISPSEEPWVPSDDEFVDTVLAAAKKACDETNKSNDFTLPRNEPNTISRRYKRRVDFYQNESGSIVPHTSYPRHDNPDLWNRCSIDNSKNHQWTRKSLERDQVNTMFHMLKRLYDASRGSDIKFFPIKPEERDRSTNPIHPLALIQSYEEVSPSMGTCNDDYITMDPVNHFPNVLKWLNQTFQWRPVFDWDWFMVPEATESLDDVYRAILVKNNQKNLVGRVRQHFQMLRDAEIPVHILIGRRPPSSSSLYWGWPYSDTKWKRWLEEPFDANLAEVADLVDSLSIFYDLRNPLPKERLGYIDAADPYKPPDHVCPYGTLTHPLEECYFKQHQATKQNSKQKMANRHVLGVKTRRTESYEGLATGCVSAPPVGENANDHPSDDSEFESDCGSEDPLAPDFKPKFHHVARRAAFVREAVGWQRFWSTYALKLTRLTLLRVRMPCAFDRVGSWRLSRLLDRAIGWGMVAYTDERQHMQTREDRMAVNAAPGGNWIAEDYVFPAGRFVRRSWIWPQCPEQPQSEKLRDAELQRAVDEKRLSLVEWKNQWGNRMFLKGTDQDEQLEQERENAELTKAVARAATAGSRETKVEERLLEDFNVVRRLLPFHGRVIREVWNDVLQRRIDELKAEWRNVATEAENARRNKAPNHEELCNLAEERISKVMPLITRLGGLLVEVEEEPEESNSKPTGSQQNGVDSISANGEFNGDRNGPGESQQNGHDPCGIIDFEDSEGEGGEGLLPITAQDGDAALEAESNALFEDLTDPTTLLPLTSTPPTDAPAAKTFSHSSAPSKSHTESKSKYSDTSGGKSSTSSKRKADGALGGKSRSPAKKAKPTHPTGTSTSTADPHDDAQPPASSNSSSSEESEGGKKFDGHIRIPLPPKFLRPAIKKKTTTVSEGTKTESTTVVPGLAIDPPPWRRPGSKSSSFNQKERSRSGEAAAPQPAAALDESSSLSTAPSYESEPELEATSKPKTAPTPTKGKAKAKSKSPSTVPAPCQKPSPSKKRKSTSDEDGDDYEDGESDAPKRKAKKAKKNNDDDGDYEEKKPTRGSSRRMPAKRPVKTPRKTAAEGTRKSKRLQDKEKEKVKEKSKDL
ncbi:hypothetical protein BCR34DRAFT_651868 [Clohesyomyces aquaticus]|uniref:Uncharacterized protein n=1 Tax=Clohesyomyces aquaticus TaxID=1231657 RepID=A0A1Y1ZNS5_9PLEO|nr:hypothetical protein BCR34DRAFT_651868 [Clohesyomyces aquaticus]